MNRTTKELIKAKRLELIAERNEVKSEITFILQYDGIPTKALYKRLNDLNEALSTSNKSAYWLCKVKQMYKEKARRLTISALMIKPLQSFPAREKRRKYLSNKATESFFANNPDFPKD